MTLADALTDWTDWDGAEYSLGRSQGLFGDQTFAEAKWVFWTDNSLGNELARIFRVDPQPFTSFGF